MKNVPFRWVGDYDSCNFSQGKTIETDGGKLRVKSIQTVKYIGGGGMEVIGFGKPLPPVVSEESVKL